MRHDHVSAWGKLTVSGTKKKGYKIDVNNETMNKHSDRLKRIFSLIRLSVKRKSMSLNEPQKYGQGYVLIVTFDDWLWFKPEYIATLEDFVNKHVLTLKLNFSALYVVGLSGKTCVHFEPPKIQDSLAKR